MSVHTELMHSNVKGSQVAVVELIRQCKSQDNEPTSFNVGAAVPFKKTVAGIATWCEQN